MKKLLLFIALALGLWASPASAQCNGNFAAGAICGTNGGGAPGPITSWTPTGDVLFGSGRPWCDVRAKGAKGDGATDDTAAFQACVMQLTNGIGTIGGILYVPPAPTGQYCLFSGLSITTSFSIEVLGSSYGDQTELSPCNHDVTLLTLNNAPHSVRNIGLQGPTNINTTHDTLVLGANCTECLVDHVKLFNGRYAINVAAADARISNISANGALGGAVVYTTGSFSCNACKLDTAYPVSTPVYGTTFSAWQANHSYSSVGTVVSTAGSQAGQTYLIQLSMAGTSGSSAPTLQPYNTNITDGTAIWLLVGLATNAAVQCDTGCSTLTITNRSDLSGAYTYALYLTGNAQTVLVTNSFMGGWYSSGVYNNSSVGGITLTGNQIQNCINTNCQAIYLHGFGDALIQGNQMFGVGIGVEVDSAVTNVSILNNFVFGAHVAGVYIGGTVSNISVIGNQVSTSASWGTNAIGIDIATSGTDYLTVFGNECHGAASCVSNSSTGTHNVIETTPGILASTPWPAISGGSGISSPTAHSLLQAEGASNFGLLTTATAGNIIVDQGSGSDWASVTLSQDCTLAGGGAITCTKTNNVAFGNLATANANIGLTKSGTNLNSNAEVIDYFAPGLVAAVSNTKGAFTVWKNASTVDNIAASATAFTCSGNPTVTVYECGTSPTCASPTVIGGITITAAGTAVSALTLSSSTINAGDYTAWAISAGTCTSLDIHGKIQAHAN